MRETWEVRPRTSGSPPGVPRRASLSRTPPASCCSSWARFSTSATPWASGSSSRGTLPLAVLAATAGHPGYTDIRQRGKDTEKTAVDESRSVDLGYGRPTERACRTSRLLRGYSGFPGLHQAAGIAGRAREIRKGEATEDTTTVAHAVTDCSPRWTDATPMTKRSTAVDRAATVAPHKLIPVPP